MNSGCLVPESKLLILNDTLSLINEVNNFDLTHHLQELKFGNVFRVLSTVLSSLIQQIFIVHQTINK